MGNTFGTLFRVTTWGESHGGGVGAVVDGCPARLPLGVDDIQPQLDRRRPGQSRLTTPRRESDTVRILSGVFEERTLGTPILLLVPNEDARPGAYEALRDLYRPSHADYTYDAKYGIRAWPGGGRSSARETVGRVAAGAIAEKVLRLGAGIEITAWVRRIGTVETTLASLESFGSAGGEAEPWSFSRETIDATPVRCPDPAAAGLMIAAVEEARRAGDSLGGMIECVARGVPAGLGEPVFDRLESDLAHAVLCIPACIGFELGAGFAGSQRRASEHNDSFRPLDTGGIGTVTNRSGGIQGGISNGETIWFRAGFKPTPTIRRAQETVDRQGGSRVLEAQGRHDPCVVPRAVPIVESMTALVLCDHWLRQLANQEAAERIERAPRIR